VVLHFILNIKIIGSLMILVEYNEDKQLGFFDKFCFGIVGLQTDNGKFKLFRNQNFYFYIHQIELKAFYANVRKDHFFTLYFSSKQYWIIYDTQ